MSTKTNSNFFMIETNRYSYLHFDNDEKNNKSSQIKEDK